MTTDKTKAEIAVVTGPTASGKTRLSVELAKIFNGEIVSADSMQIYKGMDIGTAKVTPEEMQGIPHHMIDVAYPHEQYSVSRYVEEASACIDGIISRGKLPIVVGGTNLYIDSLISGLSFADNEPDGELRAALGEEYDCVGGEKMLERLHKIDPERAEKLHPADRRRIIRAIEVYELTGKTITQHDAETRQRPARYAAAKIALCFEDRQQLYGRIDERVDKMVGDGLFAEVKSLLDGGLSPEATAMQAIGYKEPAEYFAGRLSMPEAIELIKQSSRRYAKRQLTWLRRDEDVFRIRWGENPDFSRGLRLSTDFLHSRGL